MKVRVIQPDLKLLLNSGAFVNPKVGDVIDIANAHAEIRINNVEPVKEEIRVSKVVEQLPTKGLDFTDIINPPMDLENEVSGIEAEESTIEAEPTPDVREKAAKKAPERKPLTVKRK